MAFKACKLSWFPVLALAMTAPSLALTEVAFAQDSDTPITTLKVTTRIVLVDVVVTDKKGNLVNNLTKDDFILTEDKVPQQIRSFELPSSHAMPPGAGAIVHSTADLAKIGNAPVTVLVIDELNTAFEDMSYARWCVERYLNAQPPVLTQPTTLLLTSNSAFTVVHDYTQDREALRTALHKHMPELPWKMMHGDRSGGGAERMSMSMGSLYQIAKASGGTPGRKNIIWIGRGFPTANLNLMDDKTADSMQTAMRKITQVLLESRVTLYTIDPTVMTANIPDMETVQDLMDLEDQTDGQPFADEIKFSTLAPATGGTALFSRNDIDKEVATSISQGSNYYTLSYAPANRDDNPLTYRQIRVSMKNPNLIAVARDGYYPPEAGSANPFTEAAKPITQDAKTQLLMDIQGAANSTMTFNGLAVTAQKDGHNWRVAVQTKGLQWSRNAKGVDQAEVTLVTVAFSARGKALAHNAQELSALAHGDVAKSTGQDTADFVVPVTAPPGTARIRFVVRDAVSGKVGTADAKLP